MLEHNSRWTGLPCTRQDPHDEHALTGHVSQASAFAQQGMEDAQND